MNQIVKPPHKAEPFTVPVEGMTCVASLGAAGATAMTRVMADQHHASDVLTGAAVGALTGFTVSVLKPGLAAHVPTPLLAGRWATDPARVYTAVTWPGA